ncbi:hypothetical protein AB0K09_05450 [Streptomyces sp. NPDC049577]|uniref:hypothetical protein n=1 Tax=Streptomyces sp. NPDC049577 TaxID=3155153 RepID=UPI00343ED361
MTVCAPQSTPQSASTAGDTAGDTAGEPAGPAGPGPARRPAFTVTVDGSYAAWLALGRGTDGWFPERWSLDGPEPYAVPLPGRQPEEPDSQLQPLTDGRVLIRRRVAERYALSLLYPAGPGTGELPLGAIECSYLSLLPPAPDGSSAYALVHGERSTTLWRVHGGTGGPELLAEVPGRCEGGAWLDRRGRLLALDRELEGLTKAVVVDLGRGETSPLLQITERSNDRLLLAEPDSGLLVVRSDAPGTDRLGWGVLGSARPVRFPECLVVKDATLTPIAAQPGQGLAPEGCAVAFRVDRPAGSAWVGVWRPAVKALQQFPAPAGWLAGAGLWTAGGELRLPYVTATVPCGLARLALADPAPRPVPLQQAPLARGE